MTNTQAAINDTKTVRILINKVRKGSYKVVTLNVAGWSTGWVPAKSLREASQIAARLANSRGISTTTFAV